MTRLLSAPSWAEDGSPAGRRRPLRVAHLGARVHRKGWTVFEELAASVAGDERYRFFHLGMPSGSALPDQIRHVPVCVDADRPDAMIEAVAEHRIDVVVNWSLWPETFCFTAHEALAGGAFVVAREGAGNVWPAARDNTPGQACCLVTEADLLGLFEGGELAARVAAGPRRRGALLAGGGTADWLLPRLRGGPTP